MSAPRCSLKEQTMKVSVKVYWRDSNLGLLDVESDYCTMVPTSKTCEKLCLLFIIIKLNIFYYLDFRSC